MTKSPCTGPYAQLIGQYIEYKHTLGFKMTDTAERLRRFDKIAKALDHPSGGITKELADEWCKLMPGESEYNRVNRINILRGFSSYLQLLEYNSFIPKLPKTRSTFMPHIFTSSEMNAIFRECDCLRNSRKCTYSVFCTMPALIRVLYGTGIRIGEAAKLLHKDVDLVRGILTLRETKNGCDRIVPMSLSVREVCKDYLAFKEKCGIEINDESPFFTSMDGTKAIHPQTVYEVFRTILHRAGLSHGGRSKGPRLHDLRHTFCVNALVKMSEAGNDLYHTMPILMTYMGHKTLVATNRYVRITQEMYPGVLKKLDETYKYVFPEISIELKNRDDYEND